MSEGIKQTAGINIWRGNQQRPVTGTLRSQKPLNDQRSFGLEITFRSKVGGNMEAGYTQPCKYRVKGHVYITPATASS